MKIVTVPADDGPRGRKPTRIGRQAVELVQFVAECSADALTLHALAAVVGRKDVDRQLRVLLRAAGYPLPPITT